MTFFARYDTCHVGDLPPGSDPDCTEVASETDRDLSCDAEDDMYLCTRDKGHGVQHVAEGNTTVLHVWPVT